MSALQQTTLLLHRFRDGERSAADQLFHRIYELRSLAGRLMRHERDGHTLERTALVNEAYLRLIDQLNADIVDRPHFFAIAATRMRRFFGGLQDADNTMDYTQLAYYHTPYAYIARARCSAAEDPPGDPGGDTAASGPLVVHGRFGAPP